jgi:hypothetical protein
MKPIIQALVLADKIYNDVTGKKIIAGTFNTYQIGQVKTAQSTVMGGTDPGCPSLYVSLTDVHDDTEIGLQFVNVGVNEVLFSNTLKLGCKDRLATVEIVLQLPPLHRIANKEGTYSLDILWRNEILGSHRVVVKKTEPPPEG